MVEHSPKILAREEKAIVVVVRNGSYEGLYECVDITVN